MRKVKCPFQLGHFACISVYQNMQIWKSAHCDVAKGTGTPTLLLTPTRSHIFFLSPAEQASCEHRGHQFNQELHA